MREEDDTKPFTERVQNRKEKEITNISFKRIASRDDLGSARTQKHLDVRDEAYLEFTEASGVTVRPG